MFSKLLKNLPYNPSLISEISFYTARIKSESALRRTGLVFVVLAMLVQVFAYASPPDPALAARASGNDIIYGGVSYNGNLPALKQQLIDTMRGDEYVATVYEYYGITPDVINKSDTRISTISMGDAKYRSSGRWSFGKGNEVERAFLNGVRFFERNLKDVAIDPGSKAQVLTGTKADGTYFAILLSCGNPVVDTTSTPAPPEPKPVKGYFDSIDCNALYGWAYDPRLADRAQQIHIYIDGVMRGITTADQPRGDVNSTGIPGNHGFSWAIPAQFKDGATHSVTVYVLEDASARGHTEGNSVLVNSPKSFTCVTPTPPPPPPPPTPEEPKIKVCRAGEIITIRESEKLPSDYLPDQCEIIKVCLDNKLVTIKKYEYNPDIHSTPDDLNCEVPTPKIGRSKTAKNITQGTEDANNTTAAVGDTIEYTLITSNTGTGATVLSIEENLNDVLEYADYMSSSEGGTFNSGTGTVTWPAAELKPGKEIRHTITIKIKDVIPGTVQGSTSSNAESFDLIMNNVYGNAINIKLPPPTIKVIETTTKELPKTGPGSTIVLGFVTVFVAGYFYSRSRLLAHELTVVRDDYAHAGAI